MTPEEEQHLFINIEDIVVLADQMTAMFEVMVDINNPDTCQVGEAFIQMARITMFVKTLIIVCLVATI